jgi:prefoldin subunit 5
MSAIVPPLDFIPKLPAKAVSAAMKRIDKQTDKLLQDVTKTVQDSAKLPVDIKCDDPRIQQIKKQLTDIQTQITAVQTTIPKIQQTINKIQSAVKVAVAIKNSISIAQLSNPVTAPVFIAMQLTAIQDATIVNALSSLDQFSTVPASITSKLQTIAPPLVASLAKISAVCNGDIDGISLPSGSLSSTTTNADGTTDYNDLVPTEFYKDINVSDSDLQQRSDTIEQLLEQQQNLLTSLLEAPSKVYQQAGVPAANLGKVGDYYINTTNNKIYGPKPTLDAWGDPVNL